MGKLKVFLCKTGELAKTIEIEDNLKAMQELVGGYIRPYRLTDEVNLVCNDDGKVIGLPLNRAIKGDNEEIIDVIAGDFFICYAPTGSDRFLSLPKDLEEKYLEMYKWPEQIFLKNGGWLSSHPYNPDYRRKEASDLKSH